MKVKGKDYNATTDSECVATFKVKLTKKRIVNVTTKFADDSYYIAKTINSKGIIIA